MICKVCRSLETYLFGTAVCGPWYRCLACGSDTNPLTYADVAQQYQGYGAIDQLMHGCGGIEGLIRDQRTNFDLFELHCRSAVRRFLDIGACAGAGMEGMRRRGWEVSGFDVMEQAREYCDGPVEVAPDFRASLFPQRFDAILCREVIEHVEDWQRLLEEIGQALASGGVAQVQTPRPTATIDEMSHQAFHLQIFSPIALRLAVRNAGFEIADRMMWPGGQLLVLRHCPFI